MKIVTLNSLKYYTNILLDIKKKTFKRNYKCNL